MTGRQCGDCTVCCTTIGVREIGKPPHVPCKYLTCGGGGCSIYDTRPSPCRAYECAWIKGAGQDKDRPDKLGMVVSPFDNRDIPGLREWSFVADGAADTPKAQAFLRMLVDGGYIVFVQRGGKMQAMGYEELIFIAALWCVTNGYGGQLLAILARSDEPGGVAKIHTYM